MRDFSAMASGPYEGAPELPEAGSLDEAMVEDDQDFWCSAYCRRHHIWHRPNWCRT